MTTTVNLEELLTNAEAAKLLGLKPNTLEIWRCQGKGPRFIKMGALPQAPIRYLRSDVAEWIAAQRFASTSAYSPAALANATSGKSNSCRSSGASA